MKRYVKYYLIRLFRLNKGAHQVAMGFVLGFIPCWLPTFGIGPMMSVFIARFFKVNVVAAIIAASLGSFIWPVLFYLNVFTGSLFTHTDNDKKSLSEVHYNEGDYVVPVETDFITYVQELWNKFITMLFTTFGIGALINGIVFAVIGYSVIYFIFKKYRSSILHRLLSSKRMKEKQNTTNQNDTTM